MFSRDGRVRGVRCRPWTQGGNHRLPHCVRLTMTRLQASDQPQDHGPVPWDNGGDPPIYPLDLDLMPNQVWQGRDMDVTWTWHKRDVTWQCDSVTHCMRCTQSCMCVFVSVSVLRKNLGELKERVYRPDYNLRVTWAEQTDGDLLFLSSCFIKTPLQHFACFNFKSAHLCMLLTLRQSKIKTLFIFYSMEDDLKDKPCWILPKREIWKAVSVENSQKEKFERLCLLKNSQRVLRVASHLWITLPPIHGVSPPSQSNKKPQNNWNKHLFLSLLLEKSAR